VSSDPGPGTAILEPRLRLVIRAASLGLLVWGAASEARPGLTGIHLAALVLLVAAALAWVGWLIVAPTGRSGVGAALLLMGATGGALAAIGPVSAVFVGVAGLGASMAFDLPVAVGLAAVGPVAMVVTAALDGRPAVRAGIGVAAGLAGLMVGLTRRQAREQVEQRARLAVETERAELEGARAEVLAERNHMAREIHDVLAHTLGALSVQLQAMETVVEGGHGRLGEIQDGLRQSRELVQDGLEEARQAVRALRDDAAPLPEQIDGLCRQHAVQLSVSGTPRPLPAGVTHALYRVAQEGLTNARRHAPGAPVCVDLGYAPDAVTLSVVNGVNRDGAPAPGSPGSPGSPGYGLQGIRERVLLLDGVVDAGPFADGWRVQAKLPA
jgi:signal transduction histidine kinase